MLAADCELANDVDTTSSPCVPEDALRTTVFGDPGCTQPVLVTPDEPPAFAYTSDACPHYAPVADELTTNTVFQPSQAGCVATTITGHRVFALGAPVDLPTITREPAGTGRIHPIAQVADGVRLADAAVHDDELAADCQPGLLAHTTRCLPAVAEITSYFIDDQCRDPIEIAFVTDTTCSPAPRFGYTTDAFYALGEPAPMQLYQVSTGDSCVPYSPAPPLIARLVGPALPLDAFLPAVR